MKTITENSTQISGASLQVEIKNATLPATTLLVAACPDSTLLANAPVFMTQLRGYAR